MRSCVASIIEESMVDIKYCGSEGPHLTRILGLEKNRVTQNSRKWDCSKDSTNLKFPHLHVHKLKPRKWGTALMILAEVGDPLYVMML